MNTALSIQQDDLWLKYFNPTAAVEAVYNHIAQLPSNRTPERHTARAYKKGLDYFFKYLGDELPSPDALNEFVAHLVEDRKLKSSTIGSKYLAPVRLYLRKLASQSIKVTGAEREFVSDCREQIRLAAEIKTPRAETKTSIPALWRPEFTRLNIQQVNAVLRQIDLTTLAGLRDYVLLHIAFATGMRLAELARITPDAIKPDPDGSGYIIVVRRKRSNIDPVPLSKEAHANLMQWIDAYNADLPAHDPRRITGKRPVWQPIHSGTTLFSVDRIVAKDKKLEEKYRVRGFDEAETPLSGMAHQSISQVIGNRTESILGSEWRLAAHDTRRTCTAIAYDAGMPITDIQLLLGHAETAQTWEYVGTKPDFHKRSLSTYVQFG